VIWSHFAFVHRASQIGGATGLVALSAAAGVAMQHVKCPLRGAEAIIEG
jgi:hypothetical protein